MRRCKNNIKMWCEEAIKQPPIKMIQKAERLIWLINCPIDSHKWALCTKLKALIKILSW